MPDFLLEVGLEEIPARMVAAAQAELARRVEELLTHERLLSGCAVSSYSTPRRLAVLVRGVLASQADAEEQLTGPSWAVAFKNGEPTPAAQAFAKKAGVEVSALQKVTTAKGEYVSATVTRKGRSATDVLTEQLPKELASLYWPKNMYWRAGKPERFVRPVKWLLAILDHAIVPVEFAGVHVGNLSYGHRILHGDHVVTINKPTEYAAELESAKVLVDVEARRHRIRKALDAATRTVPGARWREDEALVDIVTHLTEWPSVLLGTFEAEYLSLPEEVLVTVMRDHQKYFAVEDASGKLAPHFLAVLNTEADEQGIAVIRHGNERVLRSRFSDARFFWDFDQKIPLVDRVEMLRSVTFQKDLGSYYVKTQANLRITEQLTGLVEQRGVALYKAALLTATRLAKTDLTAELVKEFTELQGIVGGLYARAQGLGETVAQAIYSQYMPASTDDAIPLTIEGQILGLADRFQTIAAMFAIGLEPTGSKDPFALRRAANGVVKILAESELPLALSEIVTTAINQIDQAAKAETKLSSLATFFRERVEFYLRDVRGFSYDVVNAVLSAGFDDVRDAIARAEALTAVRSSEDFAAISAAFKRMKNIVTQASEKGLLRHGIPDKLVDTENLTDAAESALYQHAEKLALAVETLRSERKYRQALEQIATLRPHVDLFFDKVMVMVDDPAVRQNRLALIALVLAGFSSIADFSEIVTG
ncbi:glycine--tRNA ligase subunit beta [Alloacidobacterium sp.]|uniref:glycine--tRNA ligase subunit beta n=1 Tax=Alloacidobacterium sp. TaxID=2951999 RepID=UPI002D3B366C|nr:glycine--tRNA ligase subunit beta [Alloacidobacterium sp.]HYK35788.1 glycine--tRNA ligase subunit beta [Alloacidobacterium sp.]